jgi:formamidopyrimidine-DNA glycosylase
VNLAHTATRSIADRARARMGAGHPYNPLMPELPDLAVLADAFHAALAGRPVLAVEAPGPLTLRGTPAEQQALVGQQLRRFYRRGKFLWLELDRDRVAVNAMLTGRLQLAGGPTVKRPQKTVFVMRFGGRAGGPPDDAVEWTAGASWMPESAATPELRYKDATQMGKVYLLPAGVDRPVPGTGPGEMGPDADDPALTPEVWRERITRHPGELKNLLRNQEFVAGIGNAYSDEILHAARLNPMRKRSSLAPEEVDELYSAARSVLAGAVEILRRRVPPAFETEVRDFMAVHGKGGQSCPRCGHHITQTEAGGFVTSYCRGCQR